MADGHKDEDHGPSPGAVIYVASVSVVLVLSVMANILVIYVIAASKTLRNTTNVFICNLAIADILIAGVVVPQNVHHAMHISNFVEGSFGCKSTTFLPVMCTANSLFNMVAAAYDKHRAIVNFAKQNLSITKAYIATIVMWLLAIIVACPTLAEYNLVREEIAGSQQGITSNKTASDGHRVHVYCGNDEQAQVFVLANAISVIVFVFIIPFLMISVLYGHVGFFIWKKSRSRGTINSVAPEQAQQRSLVSRRAVRVVIMLVTSVILFAILRTPYFIIKMVLKVGGSDGSNQALSTPTVTLNVFLVLGTAHNILVYSIFNKSFRKHLVVSATRCCGVRKGGEDASVTGGSVSQISPPAIITGVPTTAWGT